MELIIGTVLGFLSGMGVGGGSLLLLWLTAVKKLEIDAARCINLLFFFPAAVTASCSRLHQLPIRDCIPAIIVGCTSTVFFFYIGQKMHPDYLRRGFGLLLLIVAFREFKASKGQ